MNQSIIRSSQLISRQISERFKNEILNGRYHADKALPSFGALAESFGVSKSTVHEAFKQLASEGFLFTKQGKGTFINPGKIKTRKKEKLREIGILAFNTFSSNDNSMIPILESLNTLARKKEFNLNLHFIHDMSILSPKNSAVKEMIAENRYQGLILVSPVDLTSRYSLNIPNVTLDNSHAVALAIDLFFRKRIKKITVFTGPEEWERQGILAYSKEISDSFTRQSGKPGIEVDFVSCDYSYMDAKAGALKYLTEKRFFQGFFFQSDIIAKGALAALKEKHINTEDLCLVNYCDLDETIVPNNIKKPLFQMGAQAYKLLENIYKNKEIENKKILLKSEFKE
jgi:DNA-binding transcriptional regulator YhcF (GntR family)